MPPLDQTAYCNGLLQALPTRTFIRIAPRLRLEHLTLRDVLIPGLPRGFDLRLRRSGSGLRTVLLLADHLRARVVADTVVGARFTLTLPAPSGFLA